MEEKMLNQNQFGMKNIKGFHDMRNGNEAMACFIDGGVDLVAGDLVKLTQLNGRMISVTKIIAATDKVFGVVKSTFKDAKFKVGTVVEVVVDGGIVISESAGAIDRGADVCVVLSGMRVGRSVASDGIFTIDLGAVNAGEFKLGYGASVSAAIAFGALAAAIQTALRASNADLDACVVTRVGGLITVDIKKQITIQALSVVDNTLIEAGLPYSPVISITQEGQAGTGTKLGRSLDKPTAAGQLIRVEYFLR